MTTSRPLRADAQRNRDALIARARELFDVGDEDVRFDDFAGLAGVGTGTLYRHFPTREALAAAVFEEEAATLCDLAHQLRATLPAGEALGAFLHRFVDHIDTHQRLTRRLVALLGAAPGDMAQSGQNLEKAVGELVADAAADGAIRDDIPASAVMMALHGISGAHDRPNWRADAHDVLTLVLDGLRLPHPDRPQLPRRTLPRSDTPLAREQP
jgi:AcrR family transcriptional regulator